MNSGSTLATSPLAERDPDEIDLLQYWHILWNNRWLVAIVGASVVAIALVLTLLATPIFRANSLLQIERESLQVVNVEGVMPTERGYYGDDFYQTQYELLSSHSLALRVVREAFNMRRKTLRNTLKQLLPVEAIEAAGVDGGLRPEQLDLAAFVRLADQLAERQAQPD